MENERFSDSSVLPAQSFSEKQVEYDRLSGLQNWAAKAARESAQAATLRDEIAGLLERMTTDQLTVARANLKTILDADQVSTLTG